LTFFSKKFENTFKSNFTNIQYKFKEIKKVKNNNSIFSSTFLATLVLSILIFSASLEESNAQSAASVLDKTGSTVIIENLMEDNNPASPSWHLEEGQIMYVNIINSNAISEKKIDIVKNAILSQQVANVQASTNSPNDYRGFTYYVGWEGALNEASKEPTQYPIPKNFEITESSNIKTQISIVLLTESNSRGYTGYTWLTSSDDQILKSTINIYDVNDLTDSDLATIVRHEFGHAIGLLHSSLPDDLMHNVINTSYPYIFDSHIDSLRTIYGGQDSGAAEIFTLPSYKQTAQIKISGIIKDYKLDTFVTVKITDTSNAVNTISVMAQPDDSYTVFYLLNHDSVIGGYSVVIWYNQSVVDVASFSVIDKEQKNEINGSEYASVTTSLDNGGWPQDVKWKRYHKISGTWELVEY